MNVIQKIYLIFVIILCVFLGWISYSTHVFLTILPPPFFAVSLIQIAVLVKCLKYKSDKCFIFSLIALLPAYLLSQIIHGGILAMMSVLNIYFSFGIYLLRIAAIHLPFILFAQCINVIVLRVLSLFKRQA